MQPANLLLSRNWLQRTVTNGCKHVSWTLERWRTVLFSGKTWVCPFCNDRRRKIYRRQGKRFTQARINGKVGFWGGISIDGKTEFKCISRTDGACRQGSLTANRYIRELLKEYVVPYANFVVQWAHINARHYTNCKKLCKRDWDSS